jgi:serine/threonine-protein kinase
MVQPAQAARVRLPDLEKYEVLEEIGHGGMATVYRARDRRLGREVALKVIHPHLRESTEVAHRFRGEAQAVAKLRHPNIVEVYDVSSESEPEQYLVVELVRGRTLRRILKDGGRLPPEVAVAVALEILSALSHANTEGVVHRDVKPENVMIEHEVRSETAPQASTANHRVRVKLTDFGIAKLLDAQGVTSTGQVLGSPAHMAPEQIEGGDVDARADVFGLGVLLYECMVGHLPFEGANPAQVLRRVLDGQYASAEREDPKIGRLWSALLDRALAREPKDRFKDAAAMRQALSTELHRVTFLSVKGLLTDYFDDPAGYAERYEKALVDKLAKLGSEARREGRHMEAAAYTNRALAYAPNDPALLAIASSLGRREAGRRFVRRGVPLIVGTIAFGAIGFWGSRALIRRPKVDPTPVASVPAPLSAVPVASHAVPSATPSAVVSVAKVPLPAPPVVKPLASAATKPAERAIVIDDIQPQFGVLLAIDEGTPHEIQKGTRIVTTHDSHSIMLTCKGDACEPLIERIGAGEQDISVDKKLTIRPAMLVVESQSDGPFQIPELPQLKIGARELVKVPMKSGRLATKVVDLSAPNRSRQVVLSAGKEARVSFEGAEP